MTLLSICIPATGRPELAIDAVQRMLASERDDFEIVVGGLAGVDTSFEGIADPRLRLIATPKPAGETAARTGIANAMMPEARGEWITLVNETDYADPGIAEVICATLKRVPDADALSWGRAAYTWPAARDMREISRISMGSRLTLPEQKDLMRQLFYWDGAGDRPDCFFGAWHGAVRRDLLDRIRDTFSGVYFEQASPEVDSLCKTVMLARRMVYWERPMSVQGHLPFQAPLSPGDGEGSLTGFPFAAKAGVAARTAMAIEGFKQRYGIELSGWEEAFVAACAHDCETATSAEAFAARKAAYAEAITAWRGKPALKRFKPEFKRKPSVPRFQGVKDQILHFDMEMGGTRTAADFYGLIDAMLFPVALLDAKLA